MCISDKQSFNRLRMSIRLSCTPGTIRRWFQGISRSQLSVTRRSQTFCSRTISPSDSLMVSGAGLASGFRSVKFRKIPKDGHLVAGRTYDRCSAPDLQCWFRTRVVAWNVFLRPWNQLQQSPNLCHQCATYRRAVLRNGYRLDRSWPADTA